MTFVDKLAALLSAIQADPSGHVLTARDYSGIACEQYAHRTPEPALWLLTRAATDVEIRIAPLSQDGQIGALWVTWPIDRLAARNAAPGRIIEQIRPRLARQPQPSAIVDAGAEVVVLWRLHTPLPASDALPLLQEMAKYLGGQSIEDLAALTLPLAGIIRTLGNLGEIPRIEIAEVSDARHTPEHVVPREGAQPQRNRK